MSDKSKIEWTDATWNPTRGCSRVSAGCLHCYAETFAATRLSGPGQAYEGLATHVNGHARWTNEVRLVPNKLDEPLHWHTPKKVFVDSMSDLFHEQVPIAYIARVFAVIGAARWHTFQVLTKRPERMYDTLCNGAFVDQVEYDMGAFTHADFEWPFPWLWLGVSVEDQATVDSRIPLLLETPATVRFISLEPQLEDVDLDAYLYETQYDAVARAHGYPAIDHHLDWVIQGGESGPDRRPFDKDWARHTRDQCVAADVPYFFKQAGGPRPAMDRDLDGQVWDQFPAAREAVLA